jgi:hypothetical protein
MAKYTKQDVATLDPKTIDFCEKWLWDTVKRFRLTDDLAKTKARRELNHARTDAIANAVDMLEILRGYNQDPTILCDEFSLFDEDLPRRTTLTI